MKTIFLKKLQFQPNQLSEFIHNILFAILVILICVGLSRILKSSLRRLSQKFNQFDATALPILTTGASYTIYTIGTVIVLDLFGVNTASLVALLGTVGLAIGFALKDTLSNIAAGIMLLLLKPFRVNDTIEYGDIVGKVTEINLFTTILETADGIFVCSPNGSIWSSTIKNYTKNGRRRMVFKIGISLDNSINDGLNVLASLAAHDNRILKDPKPQVVVASLGDSSINLELRCWANIADFWSVYWEINQKIKTEIESAGLSIPLPQRELHVIQKD